MIKKITLVLLFFSYTFSAWAQPCSVRFTSLTENTTNSTCNYKDFDFTITGGTPQSYKWYYGDGNNCTCKKPKNFYTANDTFTLIGIVYDANGCADSVFKQVIIQCDNPCDLSEIGIYSADTLSYSCNEMEFNAIVSQNTETLTWYFGDGDSSNNAFEVHEYSENGEYEVLVVVKDDIGCADTAQFTVNINCEKKDTCAFKITSIDTSSGSDCLTKNFILKTNETIQSSIVSMGDGNSLINQSNFSYKYNDTGKFTVKAIALNNKGCKDSMSIEIAVACSKENTNITDASIESMLVQHLSQFQQLSISSFYQCEVIILNSFGAKVLQQTFDKGVHTVDLQSLQSGFYVVCYKNEKGIVTKKKIIHSIVP
jgi:PKD repeat protein